MTASEHADLERWVRTWEQAAPELQRVRDADIRAADTAGMIECTGGLFRDAVRSLPPQPTSGLVEQQFWFMKLQPLCEIKEAPEILTKLEGLRCELAEGEGRSV